MRRNCSNVNCFVDTPCNLGYKDFKRCPSWKGVEDDEETLKSPAVSFLPWTGSVLGIVDLQHVASRTKPRVIGVIGPHDAGKTTLLGVLYLLLSRGFVLGNRLFAGSYSLGGWENVAHWLRWKPQGYGPTYPPHTPSNAERSPGLLHLAFQNDGIFEDVLFTDAPGEWFERWAIDKDDSKGKGARWTARHASAVMFVVDSGALAGENRGRARNLYLNLSQRIASEVGGDIPVAVVWAKSDKSVPGGIRDRLDTEFSNLFNNSMTFHVTVEPNDGWDNAQCRTFIDMLTWLLGARREMETSVPDLPIHNPRDLLLSYRGR